MVKKRRHERIHGRKPSRSNHPKSYKILCVGCGKEVVVQVPHQLTKYCCAWSASKNRAIL